MSVIISERKSGSGTIDITVNAKRAAPLFAFSVDPVQQFDKFRRDRLLDDVVKNAFQACADDVFGGHFI
jgi:hypothetical protein